MEGCHLSCSFYGCKRTYTNSESLNSHVKDHHKIPAQSLPGKVFLCSTIGCDGSFSNMQQLMDHMRHHHKPNYFFLCESCKAKLRSYRTLLKHLQTCAKVAKTKAIKTEAGLAADTDSGVPLAALELEPSGPLLATDESQQMESEPSLPLISAIQPSQKAPASGVLTQPTAMGLPAEVVAANAQRVAGQADAAFSPFPPRLSPVPPASLPETAQLDQQPPPAQWSPRIGPPCLPSSPPHTPPGSNAVWRKNQDLPASLLHRWTSSPANQALSREEVQVRHTELHTHTHTARGKRNEIIPQICFRCCCSPL
ncbi:zinc finger protein 414 isoform X2 [Brachyhypopomus gauderio]|uniref:zinc finger protein 414 isoform X2 n=1 Tax=Brachyhypopomus gauderio TaxID=698409 RepID=UPI004040F713